MPSPKMETKLTIRSLIAGLTIVATLLTSCGDTSEKEFYEGKTISVYVGRPPGSGADLAVRSFVRFWQEHIPGRPTMVVKNLPGRCWLASLECRLGQEGTQRPRDLFLPGVRYCGYRA